MGARAVLGTQIPPLGGGPTHGVCSEPTRCSFEL